MPKKNFQCQKSSVSEAGSAKSSLRQESVQDSLSEQPLMPAH